jgi:hypothetical protein
MTYADCDYAKSIIQKATKEVTIVVEKGHTNFNIEDIDSGHSEANELSVHEPTQKNVMRKSKSMPKNMKNYVPAQNSAVSSALTSALSPTASPRKATRRHSPRMPSPRKIALKPSPREEADEALSEEPDDVLQHILAQGSDSKAKPPSKTTKSKKVTKTTKPVKPKKNDDAEELPIGSIGKLKTTKIGRAVKSTKPEISDSEESLSLGDSKPKKLKTKKTAKVAVSEKYAICDSEESSLGSDFDEDDDEDVDSKEKSSPKDIILPQRKSLSRRPYGSSSLSRISQGSFSGSMRFEDYEGDYIHVTVKKKSEDDPGIAVEKSEGKFFLTALPEQEKRIAVGSRVLAINGTMNINTVVKAEDLINRAKGKVVLMIDFNTPVAKNLRCPCCAESMTANGNHVSGGSQRPSAGRKGRGDAASVAGSARTAKTANRSPPGSQVQSIPETPAQYNYDEYDSDSDGSDENEAAKKPSEGKKKRRSSIERFQTNEKFMVRVTKAERNEEPGISLREYQGAIYVSEISEESPFYFTPMKEGDKILSVNGRKVSLLKSAANIMGIIEERDTISIFVHRLDPNSEELRGFLSQLQGEYS